MVPPAARPPQHPRDDPSGARPGQRLGLPAQGPGSVAGWGRRIVGLLVDWAIASVIARALLSGSLGPEFGPLAVFALMHVLLVGTAGFTIGHFAAGLVVRRLDGRPVGLLPAATRTALICLVLPAVVYDADRRGLHDRAAETVVLRR